MNSWIFPVIAFGMLASIIWTVGVVYHVVLSLRAGKAVGLGWTFDRTERPAAFWMHLTGAAFLALQLASQAIAGVAIAFKHL